MTLCYASQRRGNVSGREELVSQPFSISSSDTWLSSTMRFSTLVKYLFLKPSRWVTAIELRHIRRSYICVYSTWWCRGNVSLPPLSWVIANWLNRHSCQAVFTLTHIIDIVCHIAYAGVLYAASRHRVFMWSSVRLHSNLGHHSTSIPAHYPRFRVQYLRVCGKYSEWIIFKLSIRQY